MKSNCLRLEMRAQKLKATITANQCMQATRRLQYVHTLTPCLNYTLDTHTATHHNQSGNKH